MVQILSQSNKSNTPIYDVKVNKVENGLYGHSIRGNPSQTSPICLIEAP